jgi:hypothetical protein
VLAKTVGLKEWWEKSRGRRFDFACLAVALAAATVALSNAVLNVFYHYGALTDATRYSSLVWHQTWRLMQPPAVGNYCFFNDHITWFFWLPSLVSWVLPVDRIPFLAWFTGLSNALAGFGFWLLLDELWQTRDLPPARRWAAALAKGAATLAFSLNAHIQSMLSQAHPDVLGPAFTFIFLWALLRERRALTVTSFILALSQREDMGFHLFALLFLVAALDILRRRPRACWEPLAAYACFAFAYGALALAVKRLFFQDWGIFSFHYIGSPPFHHLTVALMQHRIENLLFYRPWIMGPGLVALLWALAARNLYIFLAWAAYVPWLLLTITASLPVVGEIDLHYGYPFLIAGAWPLLAASRLFTEPRGLAFAPRAAAFGAAALLLVQQPVSVYPDVSFSFDWFNVTRFPEVAAKPAYDALEKALPHFMIPDWRVDQGVLGIAPYATDVDNDSVRGPDWNSSSGAGVDPFALPERDVNAVFYFTNGYSMRQVADLIGFNHLDHHYKLRGGRIYLSTSVDIKVSPELAQIFEPALLPPDETRISAYRYLKRITLPGGGAQPFGKTVEKAKQ